MASILDDLKGILPPEAIAALEGNPAMKTRILRGDEFRSFYDGEETTTTTTEPTTTTTTTQPATTQGAPGNRFDLSAFESLLDKRLGNIDERIKTGVEELVKKRGDELVNNAVKVSVQRADELNRIYVRHASETGKPFDSADFNTYLEKPENKGKFSTITQAYESYVAPLSLEREVDRRVKEKLTAQSGQNLPGVTPPSSSSKTIEFFKARSTPGGTGTTTGAGRAAAMLDRMQSGRAAEAS